MNVLPTLIYIYIYIIAEKLLTVFVMLINMNYLKAEIWQIGKKFGNRTCVKIVRMAFFISEIFAKVR